jgi:hypothetical protein
MKQPNNRSFGKTRKQQKLNQNIPSSRTIEKQKEQKAAKNQESRVQKNRKTEGSSTGERNLGVCFNRVQIEGEQILREKMIHIPWKDVII